MCGKGARHRGALVKHAARGCDPKTMPCDAEKARAVIQLLTHSSHVGVELDVETNGAHPCSYPPMEDTPMRRAEKGKGQTDG